MKYGKKEQKIRNAAKAMSSADGRGLKKSARKLSNNLTRSDKSDLRSMAKRSA
jgi:CHASE3 domain sensor protein